MGDKGHGKPHSALHAFGKAANGAGGPGPCAGGAAAGKVGARQAKETAKRRIAEAKAEGSDFVSFNEPDFRALTELPEEISELSELRTLILSNTQISDAGLTHLVGLTGLTELYLGNTQISDAGLAYLGELSGLNRLDIDGTQISDSGLVHLKGMQGMRHLSLNNTMIGDAGLAHLAGLRGLARVYLDKTQVSEAGLIHLAGLERLEFLDLDNTQVRDLRPLLEFASAWEKDGNRSLDAIYFGNIPALALDDTLRELSKVEIPPERTAKTLTYLAEVRDDWPPLPAGAETTPPQSPKGLRYGPTEQGQMGYDPMPAAAPATKQLQQLHQLLCADLKTYLSADPAEEDLYSELTQKVARYQDHLGKNLGCVLPVMLWKSGNDLRIELREAQRSEANKQALSNFPPLASTRRTTLESLVSLHNAFASLHPEIAELDAIRIDPADRHTAQWSAALNEAMVQAISMQVAMVLEEVRRDFIDLDAVAKRGGKAGLRALNLEDESLQNFIKAVVARAVIETKDPDSVAKVLGGDVRGAVVGAAVSATLVAGGPELAQSASQLLSVMEPSVSQALAGWYGSESKLKEVIDWVLLRRRLNPEQFTDSDDRVG
ncbi:MAG: hypothetical protein GY952_01910 [Rhodobacteraceae bacterium]|nr:hypothetical protein [Paracoccaceae bacterium]